MRTRRGTYTAYSIGCAGVWGVILLLAQRRLDPQTRNTLRLVCSGWWRLRIVSIMLIALGLISTIRMLATGKRPPRSAPDA